MNNDLQARLDAVFQTWNRSDAPGVVASVVQRGVPLLRKGYGLSSFESMVANNPSTRMRIGSTTKHFACVLALLMQREGLIDIDAPLSRWFDELPAGQARRTLRELMNHTGGTRDYIDLSLMSNGMSVLPMDGPLDYQCRQQEDNFAPGERFTYNNGGYRLLSIAIERVLDMPFADALKKWLFTPLGLHDTELWVVDSDPKQGVANAHLLRPGGGFAKGVFPAAILGEGGIISTLDDMQRWLAHLQAPTLWPAELTQMLLAPTRLNNGFASAYGLGLIRETWRGVELIHHAGGVVGGSCQMLAVPAHELGIIVMSNRNDVSASDLALKIVEALHGDALAAADPPATESQFHGLAGDYYCAATGDHVELVAVEGAWHLKYFGMPLPLTVASDGMLAVNLLSVIAMQFSPEYGVDGGVVALNLVEQGYRHRFDRIDPAVIDEASALAQVAGDWHSDELGADVEIGGDDARSVHVRGLHGRSRYALTPLAAGVYAIRNTDGDVPMNGTLRLIQAGDGSPELMFNTMRTRHLRLHAARRHD